MASITNAANDKRYGASVTILYNKSIRRSKALTEVLRSRASVRILSYYRSVHGVAINRTRLEYGRASHSTLSTFPHYR